MSATTAMRRAALNAVRIAAVVAVASFAVACGDLSSSSGGSGGSGGTDVSSQDLFSTDLAGQPRSTPITMGALEAFDFF